MVGEWCVGERLPGRAPKRSFTISNGKVVFGVTLMVALLALSGCLSEGQQEIPAGPTVPDSEEFNFALSFPVWVNTTETTGGLWYRLVIDPDCPFVPIPMFHYRVWSMTGLAAEQTVAVDLSLAEQWFWIPLPDTGPWIIAGQYYTCDDPWDSMLLNITSGYRMAGRGFDMNLAETHDLVTFSLPAGGNKTETHWEGDEYIWRSQGAAPRITSGRATFAGAIRMYYPDGTVWREDAYHFGSHSAEFPAHSYFPGQHRIVVEADVPLAQALEGAYVVNYMTFNEQVCSLGVRWAFCLP